MHTLISLASVASTDSGYLAISALDSHDMPGSSFPVLSAWRFRRGGLLAVTYIYTYQTATFGRHFLKWFYIP